MLRVMVENFLLFILPTVLYLVYRYVRRATSNTQTQSAPGQTISNDLNDAPFLWLFVVGAGLVLAVLIAFGSTDKSGKPGQTYYPPVVKDGKVIPGHFK